MGNETNSSCNITPFTREQILYFQNYSWWAETLGNLCCGCIGVILNAITIHVFSSPELRKSFFNRLLICLAIFDTLYIICEVSEVFRHRYNTFLQQSIFVNFVFPIRNVFMFSSIYMTAVLAFERYQAITDPVQYRIRSVETSMNQQLLTHVLPGVIFAITYYIPKFFELYVREIHKCNYYGNGTLMNINVTAEEAKNKGLNEICTSSYILGATNLRRNSEYVFWYIIVSNLTLTTVLPLCVLTFLNCRIITSLKKFSENKKALRNGNTKSNRDSAGRNNNQSASNSTADVKKTFILFSIVVLFALCHSLRVTFNIDEFIFTVGKISCRNNRMWTKYLGPFTSLAIILNSSLNFFIYALFDNGFQEVLKKRLNVNKNSSNRHTENTEAIRSTNNTKRTTTNTIELENMNGNNV